ncbi:transcriptional enhancer factor TEF-5 isoform X2 [Pan paniscus]|uniref:transcriptional enhancer factor TEF-5 isoform X2 n=1 Tax=Pan paniscus TaxID=9597 RepID=UPI003003B833
MSSNPSSFSPSQAMNLDQVSKDKALQSMASMSSAQIVSASVLQNKFSPPSPLPQAVFSTSSRFWSSPPLLGQQPGPSQDIKPFAQPAYPIQPPLPPTLSSYEPLAPLPSAAASVPVWQDRTIASSRLRLLEYSAFMEVQRDPDTYSKHLFVHIGQTNPAFSDPPLEAVDVRQIYDKFPEKKGGLKELYEKGPPNAFFLVKFWADLNSTIQEGPGAFYGVSSQYSSADSMTISVSTKVCSFGKQVVEKVETEYARLENGRFVYRIHRSPMCEYMINFIHKLKHLPEKYMMNSVLENFTILQVWGQQGSWGVPQARASKLGSQTHRLDERHRSGKENGLFSPLPRGPFLPDLLNLLPAHPPGGHEPGLPGDPACHCFCLRSLHQ